MQKHTQMSGLMRTMYVYLLGLLWGILSLWIILPSIAYARPPLQVFVSIAPQKYWVDRIGGQHVNVSVMLTSGQSPETYEPTPETMLKLAQANLYFRINVPFENLWITKLTRDNPSIKVVPCCHGEKTPTPSDQHTHFISSHIWTSPQQVLVLLDLIYNALVASDPAHTSYYTPRYEQLQRELIQLHEEISNILRPVSGRPFIVNHPAWQLFAKDYQLIQLAVEENHGAARAKNIIKLIDIAKQQQIKRVFFQRQFNQTTLHSIADSINAELVELDPLADDYINNMRRTAILIAESFASP